MGLAQKHKREILVSLLIFLLSLAYNLTLNKILILDIDDVTLVEKTVATLSGELPLVNFVKFTYAPGEYFLIALLFCLFSPSLFIVKFLFVILRSLVSVLMYHVAKPIVPPKYSLLPVAIITIIPCFARKTFYPFFTLLNLLLLFQLLTAFQKRWIIGCGLLAGLTLWFRQDLALIVWAATALCLFLQAATSQPKGLSLLTKAKSIVWLNLKTQGLYLLIMALAYAPLVGYYFFRSTGFRLVREMFWGHPSRHLSVTKHMPQFPHLNQILRTPLDWEKIFMWLPQFLFLGVFLFLLLRLWKARSLSHQNWLIFATLTVAVLTFSQTYVYAIYERLLQNAAPIYILLSFVIYRAYAWTAKFIDLRIQTKAFRPPAKLLAILLLLAVPGWFMAYGLTQRDVNDRLTYERDKSAFIFSEAGVIVPKRQMEMKIQGILGFLKKQEPSPESILVANGSLLYFFLESTSSNIQNIDMKNLKPFLLLRDLKKRNPKFVAIDHWLSPAFGRYYHEFQDELNKKYRLLVETGGYDIFVRRAQKSAR